MIHHTDAENAEYWAAQARGWIDDHVHGKDGWSVIAIAGDAVIELDDEWDADDVRALRDGLVDADIPVYATRGTRQVRIEGTDDRLPVPYDA